MEGLARLTGALSTALLWLAGLGLVVMTGIIGWQVWGRYVLNDSPAWAEQASLTLMIWYVAFASAAAVREGFHIRIVALENALPDGARRVVRTLGDLVVAACGIAMAVWGYELVERTWQHVIPSLGIPRGMAYLALPIAGGMIAVFALERAAREALGFNVRDEEAA